MYVCHNLSLHPAKKISIQLAVLILEFITSITAVYLTAFIFGAYFIDQFVENLLFSVLVASIGFMPTFILVEHTNPWQLVLRVFVDRDFETSTEKACMRIGYGCAVGAWAGCFVLPLDWDRWWQQWPLPCCFGAILGAFIACIQLLFSFERISIIKKRRSM